MKLARYLPLALVTAARAQDGPDPCETHAIALQKCVGDIILEDKDPEEGGCMACLEKHSGPAEENGYSSPTDSQIDTAVLKCTAAEGPCEGCADQVTALAECGKISLASAREAEL